MRDNAGCSYSRIDEREQPDATVWLENFNSWIFLNHNLSEAPLKEHIFLNVASKVRKSVAIHYLESGKHQIKEISAILGYNELSAFSRAFKRWTGKAPLQYQG